MRKANTFVLSLLNLIHHLINHEHTHTHKYILFIRYTDGSEIMFTVELCLSMCLIRHRHKLEFVDRKLLITLTTH